MGSKPRWEVKYEKLLMEEPITDKIQNTEEEIKRLKGEKVTGNFKSKEEYEEAVNKKSGTVAETEAKLKRYKDFEKNKGKIANILEYRKSLEAKLDKLPKDTSQEVETKKQEINNMAKIIDTYLKKIEQTKAEIKVAEKKLAEIPEEDSTKKINQRASVKLLTSILQTYEQVVGENQDKQSDLYREITTLEEEGKGFDKSAENKKMLYERRITKCNIMASNLLEGKDIGDIDLKVEQPQGKFTPANNKIKKQIQSAREENEKEENIKAGNEKENDEEVLPVEVSEFDEKHPRLAKIKNFFKNIKDKISGIFTRGEQDDNIDLEEIEEEAKNEVGKNVEQSLKEESEDELLKKIAEMGVEKTFKEQIKFNREKSANELASRFGGQYERQDGATAKKSKEQPVQEEVEEPELEEEQEIGD